MKNTVPTFIPGCTNRTPLSGTVLLAGLGGFWVIFLHICWPNHGGNGTDLPGNLLAWCFIFILCTLFWYLRPNSLKIESGITIPWLAAGAILMSLPLLWSPSSATFYYALPRIAGLWAGLGFLFTLRQCRFNAQQRQLLMYCLSAAGGVEAMIVLLELYGPSSCLPHVWQKFIHVNGRMAVGVFQQVNVTSSFLALALTTTLLLLGMRKAALTSRLGEYIRLVALGCTVILLVTVLSTVYSRTGWLGGIIAIAGIYILLTFSSFSLEGQYQWLLIILPAIGVALGLGVMHLSVSQALTIHDGSNSQRLLTLYHTFFYALHHPFIGYGAGTYEGYYQAYLAALPGGNPGTEVMSFPHNELLYQFAEGGFVGLAGALCWCALYLWLWRNAKTLLQAGALTAMLPILLHTQVEYPLYYSVPHWLALLLLLRLADNEYPAKSVTGTIRKLSISGRVAMIVLALYGSVVSLQAYRSGQVLDRFENIELTRPEQIEALNVPWIHHLRYQQDLTLLRLIRFQAHPDKDSLQAFTQENQQWLSVHPWTPLYENQIAVLYYLHEDAEARRWLHQARLTIPWKFRPQPRTQQKHRLNRPESNQATSG
ncbi:PglL family O-oligosaccharyltransferase [Klebsiella aerogenes]|uniref:PglL family O-oligosaccharyltransferase n=1 Tax=Klebsiella aerogenes TaxID=548 RepID=UPI002E35AE21|nr:Wzy polymerase domain-containing protein [Klebsiella aerogenes]